MTNRRSHTNSIGDIISQTGHIVLPLAARLVFMGTLLFYYWNSALTKLSGGFFALSAGAYYQIFPNQMDAVSGDQSQLGFIYTIIVFLGTYAEFILPALIVVGFMTRLASLGMIGFIFVQSLTDIYGHGVDAATIGVWFDGYPSGLIVDQRAFWVLALLILFFHGAGKLSVDSLIRRFRSDKTKLSFM